MARIRSIKPEFWDDRKLAKRASRDARLLYIGLWNLADEWGRVNGDPQWLKGQLFPYDDDIDAGGVAKLLEELKDPALGAVIAYEKSGDPYLFLPKLSRHQRLEPAKVPSRLPAPPGSHADESAPDPDSPGPGADENGRDALLNGFGAGSSESRADSPERGADSPETGARSPALLYVAGGREHVAGGRDARVAATMLGTALLREHTEQLKPKPPRDVMRRTGEQIDLLLDDPEITPDEIRAGLAMLRAKPKLGPGVLPGLVHEYRQLQANPDLADDKPPPGSSRQAAMAGQQRSGRQYGGDPVSSAEDMRS